MQISQADARTVRIEKEGITALLRYSLFQNQDERLPESITCRGEQTVAYFLTATIRDSIVDVRGGFSVSRHWAVIPAGELALSFCLDFPQLYSAPYLLPGVERSDSAPKEGRPVDGSLTSLPNALCLFADRLAVLVFSDPPLTPLGLGSVQLNRIAQDDERLLRVTIRFPPQGVEAAAGKPGRRTPQPPPLLHSAGDFEHSARLNVLIVPAPELFQRGVGHLLARLSEAAPSPLAAEIEAISPERSRQELQSGLESLLVRKVGICGARVSPGDPELSACAGAGLAFLLLKLFPNDAEQVELALELADFCLRAQQPDGLFYERFSLPRGCWLEQSEPSAASPSIAVETASTTARFLLELVGLARARGLPHGRYLHAATRATAALYATGKRLSDAASLLDPLSREPLARGIGVLAVLEPLRELLRLTGKDQYRKALTAFRDRYFPVQPPGAAAAAWPEVGRQSLAALRLARSAVLLSEAGSAVQNLESFFSALLPWIYLNGSSSASPCRTMGGILEALGTGRLLFRGFEACYVLARLDALIPVQKPLFRLKALLPQMLSFTLQQPPGTAFYSLNDPPARALGPLDAQALVSELYYRLKLLEELPESERRRLGISPPG
jgi:hypothetical protein